MQGGCGDDAVAGAHRDRAIRAVENALGRAGVDAHRPAPGAWGIAVTAAGWPLSVGIAFRDGHLLAQAEILRAGDVDPQWLLHRNRRDLRLVRYATSAAGDVWVHGELPLTGVTATTVDELLGRLIDAAEAARAAADVRPPRR
ncbi:MAG: hypothetical protein AB7G37_10685 [Solirubrobacteraceae bacterium]